MRRRPPCLSPFDPAAWAAYMAEVNAAAMGETCPRCDAGPGVPCVAGCNGVPAPDAPSVVAAVRAWQRNAAAAPSAAEARD